MKCDELDEKNFPELRSICDIVHEIMPEMKNDMFEQDIIISEQATSGQGRVKMFNLKLRKMEVNISNLENC